MNKEIKLFPLKAGDARMEPQHCKENLGSSGCVKKVMNGRCPTNCAVTSECGGWRPRDNALPTWDVFKGKLNPPDESRST